MRSFEINETFCELFNTTNFLLLSYVKTNLKFNEKITVPSVSTPKFVVAKTKIDKKKYFFSRYRFTYRK